MLPDAPATPSTRTARVVVADDENDLLELVQLKLHRGGVEVLPATTGVEALELYRRANPAVLVLDVMMPGMSGLDVLRAVRADDLEVPVILLTARARDSDLREGSDAGCTEYMTKPFSPAELLARVQYHLDQRVTTA